MQVASDKATAILDVDNRVGSARAEARTISIVRIGVEVRKEVSAKVRIEVDAKVRIATTEEIGFKVGVGSSGKS
jgi:hypothetical protein